ncbi:PH domain-containing protein [Halobaculum sp. D14]|uniref:PH domain-containing protein n=1 Tax=Halobaculum sp. D14 TaxID=3421642 RepID=UPI003EB7955E
MTGAADADDGFSRLHPLSGATWAVSSAVQVGSFGFFVGAMLSGVADFPISLVFVLGPLGVLAGAGWAVARWFRFEYRLGETHLVVNSGVVSRQEREIPLRRIQNVDVSRSVVQRVLGLATVKFETAGGGSTEATLNAVGADDAEWLREQVGIRASRDRDGRRSDRGAAAERDSEPLGGGAAGGGAGAESEGRRRETLYELSTRELLVLSAVSFRPGALAAPFLGAGVFDDVFVGLLQSLLRAVGLPVEPGTAEIPTLSPVVLGVTVVTGVALVAATTWVASAALTMIRYYDFRLERVGDELRYERGLLGRYSGTVPLDKLQTVTVAENVAMRRLGYASLTVETAGYAPGAESGGAGGAETTVPLAARDRVYELARDVHPFGEPSFERPPTRAWRRYTGRYVLLTLAVTAAVVVADAVLPVVALGTAAFAPLVGLALAPVAARLKHRHRGHDELPEGFVTRSGFWRRATRVVPYYRLQTVFVTRTVFQRRFEIASVTGDTASTASLLGGDATAHDVDADAADALRESLLDRLDADLAERRDRRRSRAVADEAEESDRGSDSGGGADRGSNADGNADDDTDGDADVDTDAADDSEVEFGG